MKGLTAYLHSQRVTSISLADQTGSSRADNRGEPSGSRDTATASVSNGFHDVAGTPGSDPTCSRPNHHNASTGPAADQHLLNSGSAGRANKGSTSSIPYIDCSDIDSEYDVTKSNRAVARGHSKANDSNAEVDEVSPGRQGSNGFVAPGHGGVLGLGGGLFGVVNGFHHSNPQGLLQHTQQQQQQRQVPTGLQMQQQPQGMVGNRGRLVEGSPHGTFSMSQAMRDEEEEESFRGQLPFHSTLLEEVSPPGWARPGRGGPSPGERHPEPVLQPCAQQLSPQDCLAESQRGRG